MNYKIKINLLFSTLAVLATLFFTPSKSTASTIYGTLGNFDVINDTGDDCHGFEIELEDITDTDIAYVFGSPYQRYGDPTIVPTATGVIIRYAASYNNGVWSATTPVAVAPYLPTQGHSCWTGGVSDPNIYYSSGCDHFGCSLRATPSRTMYRWLVESPSSPGSLTAFGSDIPLPAPVWNVVPPAEPGGQPIVAAAVEPPEPENQVKCGDALWAKVYTTELPDGLQPEDLDHLVIDDPDVDIVPDEPVEIESEWVLLQECPEDSGVQEFGGGAEVAAGNEAVSRRFEFYKYIGQYDPDPSSINEARCDNPLSIDQQIPERCGAPDINGVAGVGDMVGAQNVAINLAPFDLPCPLGDGSPCDDGNACTSNDICTGGQCGGAAISCDDGDVCNGTESCDSATGCVAGVPLICNDGNICTNDSCDAVSGCQYSNNTSPCDDGNACTTSDTCQASFCIGVAVSCDDGNVCTDDSCDTVTGCVNVNNAASCDDGQFCTGSDICDNGSCQHSGNPCTGSDVCNEGSDTCDPLCNNDGSCGAGENCNNCPNDCRQKTKGKGQYCCDGDLPECGNVACSESPWSCGIVVSGCEVDSDCDDGIFCNGTEACFEGSCQPGNDPCPGQGCDENGDFCLSCSSQGDSCGSNSDCCSNKCKGSKCR